jgi:hypothetical protein
MGEREFLFNMYMFSVFQVKKNSGDLFYYSKSILNYILNSG